MTFTFPGKKFGKLTSIDWLLLFTLVLGVILAITSLSRGVLGGNHSQIEYLNYESSKSGESVVGKLVVDVEGAVISPGVYELPVGSRLKDALVIAGGFSATADRSYCEKNLNMAQEIKDGQKVYIPNMADTPGDGGYSEAKTDTNMVNVNTASIAQLDTLWGVGEVRANTIVKNRPYGSAEELVSKGGMTKQIFEKNKDSIIVY